MTALTPEHTTITDFSAGDKITFAAAVAGYQHSTADLSSAGTLKAAIDAVLTNNDTAQTVYGFTYGGANYLYYNDVAGSTPTSAADDVLVKLTGTTVDLDSLAASTNDIVFA
ncbi:hypothetical protein CFT12S02847_08875 [Campylobacter fetus subsp. testudinum]|nr:hypothetical protein CFT12S02847_08875 [Campylobacter fetus subsp. testudinum]